MSHLDSVILVGSEEVQRAAGTIRVAADEMRSAATTFAYALQEHRQWMDEWLQRFQQILETRDAPHDAS